jgi:cytochrome oxidase Cu insertion factor (SCO1/SenC/PrrC family)
MLARPGRRDSAGWLRRRRDRGREGQYPAATISASGIPLPGSVPSPPKTPVSWISTQSARQNAGRVPAPLGQGDLSACHAVEEHRARRPEQHRQPGREDAAEGLPEDPDDQAPAGTPVGITVLGAFPMSAAAASRTADPIIAEALAGQAAPLDFKAPAFSLTSQNGDPVSLASLRGKVVLLTFLDPVCTTDCPLIAQEFRQADQVLGASSRHVELVAIDLNPLYHTTQYIRAFDRQERLDKVPNWLYLTGSLASLRQVWRDYGVAAQPVSAGGMILHNDIAYVIDGSGHTRAELNMNPGPGTSTTQSSFAVVLAAARRAMQPG